MPNSVAFFESDTSDGLQNMMRDFFNDNEDVQIINVSYATTYKVNDDYVLHCAALAYNYKDDAKSKTRKKQFI